jgi:hypothetical protein
VTAVDDAAVEGPHTGTITHTAASADAAYNGIAIANVTANITDNDVGPGPSPAPSPGTEGSYTGSNGNGPGPEGSFSFGLRARRTATLLGPFKSRPGEARVFNVAGRPQTQSPLAEEQTVPLWSVAVTGVVLALAATLLGARIKGWKMDHG